MAARPASKSPAASRQGSKPPSEAAYDLPKVADPPSRKPSKPAALQLPASDNADASPLPSAQPSPYSPISKVVRKSLGAQPPVRIVHHVELRKWQENSGRPPSGGQGDVQLPKMVPRRKSLSSLQLQEERDRVRRMPTLEVPMGQLEGTAVDVLPLDREQLVSRSRETTDWFRDARAINSSIRSAADTETLLAEARKRRNSKRLAEQQAPKVKEEEWVDEEALAEAAEKAAKEKAAQEKKEAEGKPVVLDMAAMWGPKPVIKKAPPQEEKAAPKLKRRGRAGSINEGVKVGDGSFLRRMSTRRITIQ